MKRLIIDIGNSSVKTALVLGGDILEVHRSQEHDYLLLEQLLSQHSISMAIISSVRHYNPNIYNYLKGKGLEVVEFTTSMELPITSGYSTPKTLGRDRLAAAIGAVAMFGRGSNIMIVDIGSAITVDMVCSGRYLGGNISPGADLRYRSLNEYTDKLPLLELGSKEGYDLFAKDTESAIFSGVEQGIIFELEGYICRANEKFGAINVIFTGGAGKYFAKKIKKTIFVNSNLIIVGLNKVLDEIEINKKKS